MRWLKILARSLRRRSHVRLETTASRRRMLFETLENRHLLTSIPVALADPLYATPVNTDLVISVAGSGVLNNDFDADGDSLTASVVANPSNGTLVSFSSNGTFTYRPTTSFTGLDTFTYKANDGSYDSNVVTVTVAVGGNFGPRTNQDDLPQNGMLMTGGLTLSQPLTLGHQLVYRSDTVNPRPVVVVETSLLSTSSVPDSIDAQLTFGGVVGSTVSYSNSGLSAGEALRFALQVDGSSLATGWYDYTLTLTAHFGGTNYTRAYTGSQAVVNRSSSEFGKGWWLDGLDQLVISGSNALLVKGNGDALYFKGDGSGGYLKADGDTSESSLVKNGDNTFTLTSKFGTEWNFGTMGLLTSVVDPNSNTIGYTYSSGKLSLIDDAFNRDTSFTYTSGYLTSFTDHASRTTSLTQTSGKLTMVTHPDPDAGGALAAPETDYAYDGTTALMTSTNDPMNFTTSFSYASDTKRLSGITYPVGTFTLTPQQTMGFATGSGNALYDPADAVAQYIDGRGKTWKFQTDRFGNVKYFKDPLNNVTTTERDHDGRPIRLTQADPDGGGSLTSPITKFGYNSSGDRVKQYQPDGNVQTWTYHTTWHLPLTFVNELSKTWTFTYDATKGNLLSEQDPLGNTTTYTYTLIGRVADITTPDPDGGGALSASVTDFAYDTYGRLEEITNPGGSTVTFTYTTADLLDTTTDELGHVWDWNYDNLNRLTSETSPDPDGGGALSAATTSYTYNANSWLIEVIDALGNDTDYTYNNRGWVTQIERPDPDGAGSLGRPTSTFTLDGEGNVTQEGQYNILLQNITYAYNDAGWRTNKLGPVMSTTGTWWTYDNLGRVTKEARGSSTTDYSYVKYAYNSRGWVTSTTESVPGFMSTVDGTPTTFAYDAAGQLTGVTDQRGYTTAYTYNDAGWQTKVTLPDPDSSTGGLVSPVIQFGYDNIGRLTTQTDPLGRVTTTAYDSRHRVTKVTEPDPDAGGGLAAPETEYAYNNASLLTSVTDPLDRVTSYTYDNSNRLLTITEPDPDAGGGLSSPVTTYAYNKMNSVTSVTDPLGNVTSTTYDNLQRQTQVTQPDPDGGGGLSSPVTSFTYNSQALLSKITDPLSRDTTFGYDNFGRRTTVTNHEGKVTTTAYDDYNRVTSVTTPDPDGAGSQTTSATSYLYDLQDRVTRITDARSYQTTFTYDAVGNLTNLQDGLSNDTAWTYDGLNRVTQENNELSNSRYFVYDAASNLIRKTDRNGRVTRYTYDDLDRLTSELWIDSGSPTPTVTGATTTQGGATDEVQRVGFDGGAFSLTGGTFTLTYSGQTTSAIAYNASAATVKSALEALSNIDPDEVAVTKITDTTFKQEWRLTFRNDLGGTNVAQTTVDASNVQAGMMPPMTEIEATDTPGATNSEVQTITIGNSPTAGTFRLTFGTEQTADIAYNASSSTVDSALEALSGIDTVTVSGSAGGPYTITFTGSHANTNVAQITGDATYLTKGTVDRTISFAYDVASQLTSTSDTDSSYAYTYDNLGRVLTTSNSGTSGVPTVVLTSAYNANGLRTSLSATKGATNDFLNTYTYDNLNRLTRVDQTGNGGATVADKRVNFAHNAVGQFTSIDRNYKLSGTWTEVATSTFTYDTLHRLTALDHKKGATDIANYDFTYDHMNRMTQFSGPDGTSDFTYDKESQVTATDHSYQTDESNTYDATGNRTNGSYTVASNNRMSSDGTYNYTYDSEGNRSTRTKISDSSLTEYTWDHRNRLTKVVERATGAGGAITKQADYKYDVFDRRISKSTDADGAGAGAAVVSRYVYFGDNIVLQFDGSNNLTNRYLHGPAVDQILADEDATNAILWPLPDHQGTIRDIVNNSGTVQNHIKYGTFGNVTAETNATIDLIYGYTSRERDDETGLQFNRGRYYDPTVGRFINHDPSSFRGNDANLSRYVTNNPVNWIDPAGRSAEPASLMAGSYGNAAFLEDLGLPEAAMVAQTTQYNYDQVNVILPVIEQLTPTPPPPHWDALDYAANGAAGFGSMIPLYPPKLPGSLPPITTQTIGEALGIYDGIDPNTTPYFWGQVTSVVLMSVIEEAAMSQAAATHAAGVITDLPQCFVAGTQVVVGEDNCLQSVNQEDSPAVSYALAASSLLFVGVSLLVLPIRRIRKRIRSRSDRDSHSVKVSASCMSTDTAITHPESSPIGTVLDEPHLFLVPGIAPDSTRARDSLNSRGLCRIGAIAIALTLLMAGGLMLTNDSSTQPVSSRSAPPADAQVVTKNIEDLRVGDSVLAWNEDSGRQELRPIDALLRRTSDHIRVVDVVDEYGGMQRLKTTDEHPFWVHGAGWTNAGDLNKGDSLRSAGGQSVQVFASRRESVPQGVPVFNIRVTDAHTYFVGEAPGKPGILVHNADCFDFAQTVVAQHGGGAVLHITPLPALPGSKVPDYIFSPPGYPVAGQPKPPFAEHFITLIDGKVFDPAFPNGIPFDNWATLWAQQYKLPVEYILDFHSILPYPWDVSPLPYTGP